jgi:hypothetical protein
MARCARRGVVVHHKRRDGGNDIGNAQVLCKECHKATTTSGAPGKSPPDFDEATKTQAHALARNQCECTSTSGCH